MKHAVTFLAFALLFGCCSGNGSSSTTSPSSSSTSTPPVTPPTVQPFVVLDAAGMLASGLDLFVNTDRGRTEWLNQVADGMHGGYPPGQQWGFVGAVLLGSTTLGSRPSRDMSAYKTLQLQLKGEVGGEPVEIGIKDNTDPDDGSETKKLVTLTTDWQTKSFALADFQTADLKRIYLFVEIVFSGTTGRSIYFRDVRYLP